MDLLLCGTQVTGNKIFKLLAASPQLNINGHRLIDVKADILSDQGYTSVVFSVQLNWATSDKSDQLPKSVIVKSVGSSALRGLFHDPSFKEKMDQMGQQLAQAHNVECAIYTLKELNGIVPMPACYGSIPSSDKEDGIIVLKDLRSVGALVPKTAAFGECLNPIQLENMLEALTSLHAWSINTAVDWATHLPVVKKSPMCSFMEASRMSLPQGKKEYPHVFQNLDDAKLDQLLTEAKLVEIFYSHPRAKYNLPSVLVHGDIQLLNILFKLDDQGKLGDEVCAFLDWQIAHPGCGVEDLGRLLSWCVSVETRRKSEDQFLQRYVELFNKKVRKPENQILFEDVKRAYDEMFSFNGVSLGVGLAALGSVGKNMKSLTEEEKKNVTQDLINHTIANYEDAVKILKW